MGAADHITVRSVPVVVMFDAVPNCTFFLAGVRLGEARLAMALLDENVVRTCYLGSIETRLGTLSVMCETPTQSEEAARAVRDAESALRALDACEVAFDNGARAVVDRVTGFWTVWLGGEAIAIGLDQATAFKKAHEQVES